jgi:hypothetical protein
VNLFYEPGTSMQHASYFPMSGTPSRPAWRNATGVTDAMGNPSCGRMCHLHNVGSFGTPPMPPACGTRRY